MCSVAALKRYRQNKDADLKLSNEACSELVWWKHYINSSFQDLVIPNHDIIIFTDAREIGWGITDEHNPSGGQWADMKEYILIYLNLRLPLYRNSYVLS